MKDRHVRTLRLLPSLGFAALGLALLAGCAQNSTAKPASGANAKEAAASAQAPAVPATPAAPAAEPAKDQPPKATSYAPPKSPEQALNMVVGAYPDAPPVPRVGFEAPGGVWLTDEEGRDYYVERMKRYEGKYKWLGEKRVKYLGVPIDIVDADEDWFYAKIYRVQEWDRSVTRKAPTAEELAALQASYARQGTESDRLEFVAFDRGLPVSGQWRNGFDFADMNHDGKLDIVHSPPRKGTGAPIVFLNNGDGSWKQWEAMRIPRGYDYGDIAVGDLNGDGNEDFVLGIHLRGLRALIGDGKGNFSEWSEGLDYQVPGQGGDAGGFSSRAIRLVDWNHDGRLDILALSEGPRLASPNLEGRKAQAIGSINFVFDGPVIFLNQGDGTWKRQAPPPSESAMFGDGVEVGDLNGDHVPDFVTSSGRMSRRDLLNLGEPQSADWLPEPLDLVRPRAYVPGITVADFDGDGRDDIALAYQSFELGAWRSGIDLLLSRDANKWQRFVLYSRDGRDSFPSLAHGDLDGDGRLDIVGVDLDGKTVVLLGTDQPGIFSLEESPEIDQLRGRCRSYRAGMADLDGDGRDELVINYADEASAFFDPQRCLNGGGLVAVKARPRASAVASTGH